MADDYQSEHGAQLGAGGRGADLVWGPEGLREQDARLLGDVRGRRVLEVGCGAAQCSRWLASHGADSVGIDLSAGMLRHSLRLDTAGGGARTAVAQADARALPFGREVFDLAFTSYGALPFVADPEQVHREVARVLRPGGRWVFSVTHPFRWAFPDDPGPPGLTVTTSYFDRTPYVERDESGRPVYVEHHSTVGDDVRALRMAGFEVEDLVEPEWPASREETWGGWSPLRGALIPGTAIYVCRLG
jgi:SAM-dependent methyltransferase